MFVVLGLLTILSSFGEVASANICETIVTKLIQTELNPPDFSDPELIRLLVRDATTPVSDNQYVENMVTSLQEVFIPWFTGALQLSFSSMLIRQHDILISGRDGL
jgi:hypothetical protein